MKETYIGLLRHAPTGWNNAKRIQGQFDIPLLHESYDVINDWLPVIKQYPWSRIVTSDLSRAYLTALALNQHLDIPIEIDSRLREQDWGIWTGDSIQRLREVVPGEVARQEAAGWDFTPPRGESRTEVLTRTLQALHEATQQWAGENILVVTHQGNIMTIANHLMDKKFLPEEGKLVEKHALHRLIADSQYTEAPHYSFIAMNEAL